MDYEGKGFTYDVFNRLVEARSNRQAAVVAAPQAGIADLLVLFA